MFSLLRDGDDRTPQINLQTVICLAKTDAMRQVSVHREYNLTPLAACSCCYYFVTSLFIAVRGSEGSILV